jgi:hypothetical protein
MMAAARGAAASWGPNDGDADVLEVDESRRWDDVGCRRAAAALLSAGSTRVEARTVAAAGAMTCM